MYQYSTKPMNDWVGYMNFVRTRLRFISEAMKAKAMNRLFHRKAKDYWSSTLAEHCNNPRQLWSTIKKVSKPPTASTFRHNANDIATHFTDKVIKIRSNSRSRHVTQRESANELSFQRVTEAVRLLDRAPRKHCTLDPAPTWLVKRAADKLHSH